MSKATSPLSNSSACLVSLVFVSTVLPFCVGVRPPQLIYDKGCESRPVWCNRTYSISSSSPATRAVYGNRQLYDSIEPLFEFSASTFQLLQGTNSDYDDSCNIEPHSKRVMQLFRLVRALQIGFLNTTCSSYLEFNKFSEGEKSSRNLQFSRGFANTITIALNSLYSAARKSTPLPPDGNWDRDGSPFSFQPLKTNRDSVSCTATDFNSILRDGIWYFPARMTNQRADKNIAPNDRHKTFEWIPYLPFWGNGNASALQIPQQSLSDRDSIVWSSTYVYIGGGFALDGTEDAGDFNNPNSMSGRVLLNTVREAERVLSGISGSSIALHCFPLLFALFPIAAFYRSVALPALILYVIITDVAVTIPSLVLGASIIRSSHAQEGDVSAMHIGDEDLSYFRGSAVFCSSQVGHVRAGAIIIGVAVCACLLGLGLDSRAFQKSFLLSEKKASKHVLGGVETDTPPIIVDDLYIQQEWRYSKEEADVGEQ